MSDRQIGPGRLHAFRILTRVESGGAFASILLERLTPDDLDRRDLGLATELVLGTLRWRGRIDFHLAKRSRRRLADLEPGVRTALRLAAYQVLFLDRIPAAAAVNGSVELARRAAGPGAAKFVNGVLRALCREAGADCLPPAESSDPDDRAALHSHPAWLVGRWIDRYGAAAATELMAADNRPAPIALRLHPPGADPDEIVTALAAEGVTVHRSPVLEGALRVERGQPFRTRLFAAGRFFAQDEASQIVPELFGGDGGPVLDLCAAPGGKSFVLAATGTPAPVVVAVDRHPGRLRRLRRGGDRLGLANLLPVAADFRHGSPLRQLFPRVLLDAPCSGTGTLRRHPEIRWRLQAGDLTRLAQVQAGLLDAAADRVAPGGVLVYSVCSLEPEEGRDLIEAFLATRTDFRRRDAGSILGHDRNRFTGAGPFLETAPHRGGLDGFFAARLDRAAR